jgi:hypothetical protein
MRFTAWKNVFVISVVAILCGVPTANAATELNINFTIPTSATTYSGGFFDVIQW